MNSAKLLSPHRLSPGWVVWLGRPGSEEGYVARRRLHWRRPDDVMWCWCGNQKWAVKPSERYEAEWELDYLLEEGREEG